MNFIERWLGMAPDGGNGSVELAALMACAFAALAVVLWRRRILWARLQPARAPARAPARK
ncbi:MAG TPA: hypothetical protein VND93_19110 [Myxococcales bacterium]|jgi:hypothetical protein|nr:hypothetical protein [Myxococcales bacterium]